MGDIFIDEPDYMPHRPREANDMSEKQMVSSIKSGDRVDSYFSVSYKKPVTAYRHGHMFEFRVADMSGRITVKYWGGEDREAVVRLQESFEPRSVVRVVGDASEYRKRIEVSVSERDGGNVSVLSPGDYDISYLVKARDDVSEMKERLRAFVGLVENPDLRRLLDSFLTDEAFMEAFSTSPASIQMHSAEVGGLLHHTLNVTEICHKALEIHTGVDKDLVIAGALLHDIGKIRNFLVSTNIDHTAEGGLVGHMALGDEELLKRINELPDFPNDLTMRLRHIVASHHGKGEWGSPVEPMIPEAVLVHQADDLDAKVDYIVERRESAETEDDWLWDGRLNRRIYLR